MALVDLRSDTVTQPTAAMRAAMAAAEVGDDAYGEDPTVRQLEEEFAARVGKKAALFVPSGVMANQIAIRLHARAGDSVIAGRRSHLVSYENGAAARNSGVQLHPIDDAKDGLLALEAISWAIEAGTHHQPVPSLLCLEDTVMAHDGRPWPIGDLRAAAAIAKGSGLAVHLDGARLWNAEVATGVSMAERAAVADTVMCCLSKGLGAPVGSLLAGPDGLIARARVERHWFGGAMRQSGFLAAAGLVAMRTMVDRLADDHLRARRLAHAAAERWPGGSINPTQIETNIVTVRVDAPEAVVDHLRLHGVLAGTLAPGVLRFVTHLGVDDAGVDRAIEAISTCP